MQNPIQKIHGLIAKFDTAMLVTRGSDGRQHARPMAVVCCEGNNDVWFFTARASDKAREIENDQEVLVTFQNGHRCSLSLSGEAELVEDPVWAAELWKDSFKIWFPKGPKDPNLALIRVSVKEGEYWDNTGLNGIKYILEAAKAYVRGTPPHIDEPEQHAHVTL